MDKLDDEDLQAKDTLSTLERLEPSPIESPFEEYKEQSGFPVQPASTSHVGLSGSGHSTAFYLTRLQRYSSYVFTGYSVLHITNTAIIPLITRSVPKSETYLLLTRPYYQSPLLEPFVVVLPIVVHVAAGLALRINRRNAALKRYGGSNLTVSARLQSRVHIWPAVSNLSKSGYILTWLVAGHAFVNRVLPWWYEGGSSGVGLGFVSHGFAKHPFLAWTTYGALIAVAGGHMVWGWARWLGADSVVGKTPRQRRRAWWTINGIVASVVGIWAAGGLGVVARGGAADGWVGQGWDDLFARIPLLQL